jgi:hypothetical protein
LSEEINAVTMLNKQREERQKRIRGSKKEWKINRNLRKGKLLNDLSKAGGLSHITGHRVKQASEVSVRTEHVTTETGGVVLAQIG